MSLFTCFSPQISNPKISEFTKKGFLPSPSALRLCKSSYYLKEFAAFNMRIRHNTINIVRDVDKDTINELNNCLNIVKSFNEWQIIIIWQ